MLRRWQALLCVPILFGLVTPGVCQEPAAASPTETQSAKVPAPKEFRGRLPAYFAAVVTKKQREDIYKIQARIHQRIAQLRGQIAELEAGRDKEIDAILRPEQLEEVQKKRMAARERRQSRSRPGGESSPSQPATD